MASLYERPPDIYIYKKGTTGMPDEAAQKPSWCLLPFAHQTGSRSPKRLSNGILRFNQMLSCPMLKMEYPQILN